MECWIDHIALNVENEEKMIDFYSKILLFVPELLEEYRAGKAPFPCLRLNSKTIIDLFPKKLWKESYEIGPGLGGMNHFCVVLSKEDWEKLVERLDAHGVDAEGPFIRSGARGDGTTIYFKDPEGNMIEARHYE